MAQSLVVFDIKASDIHIVFALLSCLEGIGFDIHKIIFATRSHNYYTERIEPHKHITFMNRTLFCLPFIQTEKQLSLLNQN